MKNKNKGYGAENWKYVRKQNQYFCSHWVGTFKNFLLTHEWVTGFPYEVLWVYILETRGTAQAHCYPLIVPAGFPYFSGCYFMASFLIFLCMALSETALPWLFSVWPLPSFLNLVSPTSLLGSPDSSAGEEPTCSAENPSSIPGSGRSPGEEIG